MNSSLLFSVFVVFDNKIKSLPFCLTYPPDVCLLFCFCHSEKRSKLAYEPVFSIRKLNFNPETSTRRVVDTHFLLASKFIVYHAIIALK
jgi:hypothetical protein